MGADGADASALLTAAETRTVIEAAGFMLAALDDVTEVALGWAQAQGAPRPGGANAAMIVGARMADMTANFVRNLREGRVRLALGLADAKEWAPA